MHPVQCSAVQFNTMHCGGQQNSRIQELFLSCEWHRRRWNPAILSFQLLSSLFYVIYFTFSLAKLNPFMEFSPFLIWCDANCLLSGAALRSRSERHGPSGRRTRQLSQNRSCTYGWEVLSASVHRLSIVVHPISLILSCRIGNFQWLLKKPDSTHIYDPFCEKFSFMTLFSNHLQLYFFNFIYAICIYVTGIGVDRSEITEEESRVGVLKELEVDDFRKLTAPLISAPVATLGEQSLVNLWEDFWPFTFSSYFLFPLLAHCGFFSSDLECALSIPRACSF